MKQYITHDEALEMMVDGDHVHTFRQGGPCIIGADWERARLIAHIRAHKPEMAGPQATAMDHAIAIIDDNGPLWIETKPEAKRPIAAETAATGADGGGG